MGGGGERKRERENKRINDWRVYRYEVSVKGG